MSISLSQEACRGPSFVLRSVIVQKCATDFRWGIET